MEKECARGEDDSLKGPMRLDFLREHSSRGQLGYKLGTGSGGWSRSVMTDGRQVGHVHCVWGVVNPFWLHQRHRLLSPSLG